MTTKVPPGTRQENLSADDPRGGHNRHVANKDKKRGQRQQDGAATAGGVVRAFAPDEGWGVIDAPEVPGGCFVHFSSIEMDGYRALAAGERVRFRFEHLDFLQDGCRYRALAVWPEP
jgi:CspA family cold shock protein